jgi:hypothetical protein
VAASDRSRGRPGGLPLGIPECDENGTIEDLEIEARRARRQPWVSNDKPSPGMAHVLYMVVRVNAQAVSAVRRFQARNSVACTAARAGMRSCPYSGHLMGMSSSSPFPELQLSPAQPTRGWHVAAVRIMRRPRAALMTRLGATTGWPVSGVHGSRACGHGKAGRTAILPGNSVCHSEAMRRLQPVGMAASHKWVYWLVAADLGGRLPGGTLRLGDRVAAGSRSGTPGSA